MRSIAFLICTVAFSYCTQAHAISLRCDGDLAGIGDVSGSVLRKCGEPFYVESSCRPASSEVALAIVGPNMPLVPIVTCLLVEDWYYNPGPGQLITTLRFTGGQLTSIRYGERVR